MGATFLYSALFFFSLCEIFNEQIIEQRIVPPLHDLQNPNSRIMSEWPEGRILSDKQNHPGCNECFFSKHPRELQLLWRKGELPEQAKFQRKSSDANLDLLFVITVNI